MIKTKGNVFLHYKCGPRLVGIQTRDIWTVNQLFEFRVMLMLESKQCIWWSNSSIVLIMEFRPFTRTIIFLHKTLMLCWTKNTKSFPCTSLRHSSPSPYLRWDENLPENLEEDASMYRVNVFNVLSLVFYSLSSALWMDEHWKHTRTDERKVGV